METELEAVLFPKAPAWWKQKHLLKLNFSLGSLFMLASAVGYDGSLMNGLQALTQWNDFMDTPAGAWLGFINVIYWAGVGISSPLTAWAANKWGRKPVIYVGYLFLILATVMQTAAQNQATFIVSRFFLGLSTGIYGNAVPLLTTECAYPTHRGIITSLYFTGYYCGSILAAWITFGTRNMKSSWAWRIPSLLQAVCPFTAIPGLLLICESPRWLISVGRKEEARRLMVNIHAGGDTSSILVRDEFEEIEKTIAHEQKASEGVSYTEMIKTPGNRHRLFITISLGILSQWVGNGVLSYYLALMLDTIGITTVTNQTLISGCLQIWNLIFAVVGASLVEKLGRRVLFMSSFVIMFISYIIITALSASFAKTGSAGMGTAVIPFLFMYFLGYDIALTPLMISYPVEIWPYRLRGRGLSVAWIAMVLGVIFNVFVNPIALAAIAWKYYIVFVVILAFYGAIVWFTFPETKGYTLEEMVKIFDGEEAILTGINSEKVVGKDADAKKKVSE